MEENKYLKTQSFSNTNNSTMTIFFKNIKKSKSKYDNSKMINQNILFNIMKNSKKKNIVKGIELKLN